MYPVSAIIDRSRGQVGGWDRLAQPTHMRQLVISALGALEFSLDGHPLDGFDYDKVRALLLLLAMEPNRGQSRAALCALLWPDAVERSARTSLSQALTRLRKTIPSATEEPFLIATTDVVKINPNCDIAISLDVRAFEHYLNEAEAHQHQHWKTCGSCAERLTKASTLYRADFLNAFSLPDSAPFEEWAHGLRESLRQRALTLHERLAQRAEWCSDWSVAIQHAQYQIKLDPLNEACHRDLIRLLALSGQMPAAHHHYEVLRQLLDTELGIPPAAATEQLYSDLTTTDGPTLRHDIAPASRLPYPPTPLIDRETESQIVIDLVRVADAHLVTLVGPGGVGKTRLALHMAECLRHDYLDGAYLIPLASITSPTQIIGIIAAELELQDEAVDAVLLQLSRLNVLLVLDNFEHVVDAAPIVANILARCANITVLVTSRIALRIRAERVVSIAPLSIPALDATAEEASQSSSVQLFVERAHAIHPVFALTTDNIAAVAAICRRLDGLPLAVELVATKIEMLEPADILQQLEPSLPALADGPRDLPARQQTMRDTIRWSTRLLHELEQRLFAHLAVFTGGFDADAVQAVHPHENPALLALAHASLIQTVGPKRWRMLEPIREFAEELLIQRHDIEQAKTRHAAHFVAMSRSAHIALLNLDAGTWMARLEADHPNLQAAIQWALQTGQSEIVLRIGHGIFRYWYRRGLWREALGWLEEALAMENAASDTPLDIHAKALRVAGVFAHSLSRFQLADQYYRMAVQIAYQVEDSELVAATYSNWGTLRKDQGKFEEALSYFDQSIALQPEDRLKFPWQSKADTLLRLGRFDEAKTLYEKAQHLNARIGDEEGLAHTLRGLADIAWRTGDPDTAESLVRENEVICRRLNHARALSWTAQLFGNIARVRGDWPVADTHYADAFAQMERMGDEWGMCDITAEQAHLAASQHDYFRAVRGIGMAQAGWNSLNATLTGYEQNLLDTTLNICTRHLTHKQLQQALQNGAEAWATH